MAIVAPTAQARLYEGGGTSQSDGNGVLIQGDDKVLVDDGAIVIHGDDKVLSPTSDGAIVIHGDDKVLAPTSDGVLVSGDDNVFAPVPGSDLVYIKGDDKVLMTPGQWQSSQFAYRHAMPEDYRVGDFATQVGDEPGKPAGRQAPVASIGAQGDFSWADGAIAGALALGLALLLFAAVRSTRGMQRPVTS
jgi:hypothetical protein